ncbi:MAG: hypothetical protein Q9197_000670 [Variospora fuerteventurae]
MLSHLRTFVRDCQDKWKVMDEGKPRSKGELFGGFPRMTFCSLDDTQKEPRIVLGFTAASWSSNSKPLEDWATASRNKSLGPYKDCGFPKRRERAVDTLLQCESKEGRWSQTRMIEAIRDFRDTEQLKPFGQGPRGLAIEFPSLDARKRCLVYLSSTEYSIAAERDGLANAASKSPYADYAETWAEFEFGLLNIKHN